MAKQAEAMPAEASASVEVETIKVAAKDLESEGAKSGGSPVVSEPDGEEVAIMQDWGVYICTCVCVRTSLCM